jgi:hypothetical protein
MFPSETFYFLNDLSFPFKYILKASATDWDVPSNNAEVEPKPSVIFFLHYKRVWCQCSKLTSMVVSRLWFGMLVQSALSMYWISLIVMWIVCICGYYMWFHCSRIQTCFDSAWFCWSFLNGLATQVSSVPWLSSVICTLPDVLSYPVSF